MWTLSGFADEIDPDLEEQCRLLDDLGITLSSSSVAPGTSTSSTCPTSSSTRSRRSWRPTRSRSPRSARRSARSTSRTTSTPIWCGWTAPCRSRTASVRPTSGCSRSSCAPDQAPEDYRDEVIRRMRVLTERAEPAASDAAAREREGDLRRRSRPGAGHRRVGRLAAACKLAWDAANYVQCGVGPFTDGYERLAPAHRVHPGQGRAAGHR